MKNIFWKWKYRLFEKIPKTCPYCNGEVIAHGFQGHNFRVNCVECGERLITDVW